MSSPQGYRSRVTGKLLDVHARRIVPSTIWIESGRIAAMEPAAEADCPHFIAPGFVDAHVHVESSMLPPSEFARLAVVHGTVATVSDPHEIANVLGREGVAWMIADATKTPLKICFGAPSCVPATPFDEAGAELGPAAVADMLGWSEIGYLSEMMNYPGVIRGVPDVLQKIAAAQAIGKPVDGHAPALRGADLKKYAATGISTDHECVSLEEAQEKISLGMKILIREGSAAKNFPALWPLLLECPAACMLCSDDKHPNDLVKGHIDALVRRAIAHGVDFWDAWRAASVHPVEHYGLKVGLLRIGDPADFIEVDSISEPKVLRTWIDGHLVAENGKTLLPRIVVSPVNQCGAEPKEVSEFALPAVGQTARVIEVFDGQLITGEKTFSVLTANGLVTADTTRDILKIALVNRYRRLPVSVALVHGVGLRRGAIATSVAHDSHNIVAVGVTDDELALAVNSVIAVRGGLAVAEGNRVQTLPLPIAGLMSDAPGEQVARDYDRLDARAKELGSQLTAPFMTLSFLALLVIPKLKISPTGLFDVEKFALAPLWHEA
jgi:adenine deaminase